MTPETYLESIMPSRDEVAAFVEQGIGPNCLSRNGGVTYDSELGWIHAPATRQDGVDKSKTFFRYEPDHARKLVHVADRSSRIHSFGDSFTHCDQVSDDETWQEYLAAHLQEPIRNYGVGGYSVYQAYLRMKRVDAKRSSPYIILNIYDHDHYRNLFRWWAVNFGQRVECGFTCPHVKINVERGQIEEASNLLRHAEDVYKLCDRDWVIETFRHDPILPVVMARNHRETVTPKIVELVAANFGLSMRGVEGLEPVAAIPKLAEQAALFATQQVVKLVEAFVRDTEKKLLVILSHCSSNVAATLAGRPRWDQSFLDFIQGRGYPVFDMRDAFVAEYRMCKVEPQEFLLKYYNSHHSPAGNYFTAWAIKNTVVEYLDPKPLPYGAEMEAVRVEHDGWIPTTGDYAR